VLLEFGKVEASVLDDDVVVPVWVVAVVVLDVFDML
jgi:hypothetical protein